MSENMKEMGKILPLRELQELTSETIMRQEKRGKVCECGYFCMDASSKTHSS